MTGERNNLISPCTAAEKAAMRTQLEASSGAGGDAFERDEEMREVSADESASVNGAEGEADGEGGCASASDHGDDGSPRSIPSGDADMRDVSADESGDEGGSEGGGSVADDETIAHAAQLCTADGGEGGGGEGGGGAVEGGLLPAAEQPEGAAQGDEAEGEAGGEADDAVPPGAVPLLAGAEESEVEGEAAEADGGEGGEGGGEAGGGEGIEAVGAAVFTADGGEGGGGEGVEVEGEAEGEAAGEANGGGVKSARHLFFTSHPKVTSVTSGGQWRKVFKTPFFHLPPADSNVKILTLTD